MNPEQRGSGEAAKQISNFRDLENFIGRKVSVYRVTDLTSPHHHVEGKPRVAGLLTSNGDTFWVTGDGEAQSIIRDSFEIQEPRLED